MACVWLYTIPRAHFVPSISLLCEEQKNFGLTWDQKFAPKWNNYEEYFDLIVHSNYYLFSYLFNKRLRLILIVTY